VPLTPAHRQLHSSSIVFFTSSLSMSFSIRAMSNPYFLGDGERARPVGRAAATEQLLWNSMYFLPVESCMRAATATWAASTEPSPETGNSLRTNFKIRIGLQKIKHVRQRPLTEGAIVVEELEP